ncbi:unnamed protein product [Calicophoron daubneyi]|uniref:Mitochondrial ornithine transporter 1 n=1 Tax=Calicophoron daubneyi TaxID=300641 RepID=A0AAV2THN7_CALDB
MSGAMEHAKNSVIGFLAGVNGGIACVYVGQPLDTIKVKMQTFPEVYSNAWQCFRITLVKDGITRGLYAGTAPALAANIAENSVLFCALPLNQHLVKLIRGKHSEEHLTDLEHACAGSLAAFWSSLTLCPTELVKCRVQALREMTELSHKDVKSSKIGPWLVTKKIFQEEGLKGFTRGLGATFAREMPGYFFFFGGYEASRSLMSKTQEQKKHLSTAAIAICGGTGGSMFWLATFPFDVIKSRMQVGHGTASGGAEGGQAQNLFTVLVSILRNEGFRHLYRGLGPTLLRTFPASAALFVAVEWTREIGHWLLN